MDEQLSLLQKWMKENTLLHVEVVLRKRGRKEIYGRLINVDKDKEMIVLYDDDQKKVFSYKLNEIDSISPASKFAQKNKVFV